MAAARRFQRPQHDGEQQNERLARARTAEQEHIPDHPAEQFQRRPLVIRKFKHIHNQNPIFHPATAGSSQRNTVLP
jgi:hypothetical protein